MRELDEAVARAMGDMGEPGPVYVEIPTDVLRTTVPAATRARRMDASRSRRACCTPDPTAVAQAVDAFWSAKRPLVITGRGARQARRRSWCGCSTPRGALYLDTQESRGLVPADHPSFVGAVRAAAMTEADVVARDRPQARLPARLRLAGGVSERPLHPHRRQRRRADRQPARRAGTAGHAGAGARRHGGGRGQPRSRASTRPGPTDCADAIASG